MPSSSRVSDNGDGDGDDDERRASSKRLSRPKPKGNPKGHGQPWEPKLLANRRAVEGYYSKVSSGGRRARTDLPAMF